MPPTLAKQNALRNAKEAKQKKLLLALAPILLGLLAWQGPSTWGAIMGGSSEATPAATVPAETTPTDTTPSAAPSGGLPDTDLPAEAGPGQLISFDRFLGRNPFDKPIEGTSAAPAAQPSSPAPAPAPPSSSSPSPSTGSGSPPPAGPIAITPDDRGSGGSKKDAPPPTSAAMAVDGKRETVAVSASFPSNDPIFRLASLTRTYARIGLVSGSFSNGAKTIRLDVGDTVTLVSQPDGLRYTIALLSLS